jgi:hypothetical protein
VALLAAATLAVGVTAARRGAAAAHLGAAHDLLAQAQTVPRGAVRDARLQASQDEAAAGLDYAKTNPALWNALAEARLLQATEGAVRTVSPALIEASVAASAFHSAGLVFA